MITVIGRTALTAPISSCAFARRNKETHYASILSDVAWRRDDSRTSWEGRQLNGIPKEYNRRIPGNARENLNNGIVESGTENYGWGCITIALFYEHILGVQYPKCAERRVTLRPIIPHWIEGKRFSIRNLRLLGAKMDIELERAGEGKIRVKVQAENLNLHFKNAREEPLKNTEDGFILSEGEDFIIETA